VETTDEAPGAARKGPRRPPQRRIKRANVNGWLVFDKPVGMTSTEAVAIAKRRTNAAKAGHAGTLDPLASGCLPIAFGEATKTVPFVVDGRKVYRFTVRWGVETDTDDAEGATIHTSEARPERAAVEAVLPRFTGTIMQVPPKFSAIKIAGERAYDLAREGEAVELAARPVEVWRLDIVDAPDADHMTFEAECGKGTYVRSLARDIGRALGSCGHVSALRRLCVGPFREEDLVPVAAIAIAEGETPEDAAPRIAAALRPVEAGLESLPSLAVDRVEAGRILRGQAIVMRGSRAPAEGEVVYVTTAGQLLALGEVQRGAFVPKRVFNLPRKMRPPLDDA